MKNNTSNNYYWLPEHQALINQYYWAYTASTSAQTRQMIYSKLYLPLTHIINAATGSICPNHNYRDDITQECHIFFYTYLLPRLNIHRLQGTLYFLYKSANRFIVTKLIQNNRFINHHDYDTDINYIPNLSDYESDSNIKYSEIKVEIINELDKKINSEKIMNRSNTIFLMLLKEYLIENEFDERGFKDYIMQKLHIGEVSYFALCSKVKIRSKLLNHHKQYQ